MSKLTDYAILILAHLARSPGTQTAHELAARSRVPVPTVSKLAKELSKAGLVVSHRGRNGGYGLARPADQISVAEIVEALEGPIALTECARPGGAAGCEIEDTCLARESWDPVSRAIETALRGLPLSAIAPYRAEEVDGAPVRLGAPAASLATVPGGRP
jgi:FeS assembly SUF system regulator